MADDSEHQFTVISETYAHLVVAGVKPKANLAGIGRDLGLKENQINSIRLRALYRIRKLGRPRNLEDKGWVWPTPNEERMMQAAAA